MARSAYNYTNKPDWIASGIRATNAATLTVQAGNHTYASPMGWVQGAIGTSAPSTSGSATGTTATLNFTGGHKLVDQQYALITGVTPAAYNGYFQVTVASATQITYTIATSNPGAVTVQGKAYKAVEVVAAYRDLKAVNLDAAVAPTFTAAATYSGTSHIVTGDVVTITLTASENMEVQGSPKITINFNAAARLAAYDQASSTATSLVFKYTAVAGDVAIGGQVSVGTSTAGGYISDILPANKKTIATVTFTAPNVSTWTAN